jgi:predicted XRE-type DNA-binding protein
MDFDKATAAFLGIGRAGSAPLLGTASAANAIVRVRYSHDAMIDEIIREPSISQNQLAEMFGYTVPWVSRVMNSEAFQARLAERKGDIVDPSLILSIDEKLRALASVSLDVVLEKVATTRNPDLALNAAKLSTTALGYGARQQNVAIQQNFVVPLPPKADSAADWGQMYAPKPLAQRAAEVQEAKIVGGAAGAGE